MDFTTIPRSLIFKERTKMSEFALITTKSLNGKIYSLLKEELIQLFGQNSYSKLLMTFFNEAYYLCTIFLLDCDVVVNFREYVEVILIKYPLPENYKESFRKMICAMCYVFLEDIATRVEDLKTIRRHLRSNSYEYMPLMEETTGMKRPNEKVFQPVELTEDLLSKFDWQEITDNYEMVKTDFILRSLGRNSFEKKRLAMAIYTSISSSGRLSEISYNIDKLLVTTYQKYGGNPMDMLNLNEKQMLNENKEDLASRIKKLEQEKIAQQKRIRDLEIKNNVLAKDRADLEKKIKDLQYKYSINYLANYDKKNNEETLRKQLREEMEDRMQKLQDKLGQTSVKLSSLVEGVKRFTKFRGLDAGKDIFFSLNYLLMKEPVWVDNTEELENFFYEIEEKSKKALVEIENKQGGLIQIKKSE